MTEQTTLDIEIGETEAVTLKPTKVKVISVEIRTVEKVKRDKLVLNAKHPDKEETIEISQIKSEKKGKLEVSGLWIAKDKDGLLIKNSAVAVLLNTFGCKSPRELIGKDLPTILDDKNYLAIKAY